MRWDRYLGTDLQQTKNIGRHQIDRPSIAYCISWDDLEVQIVKQHSIAFTDYCNYEQVDGNAFRRQHTFGTAHQHALCFPIGTRPLR